LEQREYWEKGEGRDVEEKKKEVPWEEEWKRRRRVNGGDGERKENGRWWRQK
jgi:hypothetical protein